MNTDETLKAAADRAEQRDIVGDLFNCFASKDPMKQIEALQSIGKRGTQVTNPTTLIAKGEL